MLGNLTINMANKFLKIDPTNTSQSKLKQLAPPVVVAAGASVGSLFVKHPIVKNILQGAAIAGANKTIVTLMPKTAPFLGGDGLGLTPVAAVASNDRWLYHERTPISGMGFPDLGAIQPPEGNSGYYLDAPAYMGEPEQEMMPQQNGYFRGAPEEQFYGGGDDDLNGNGDDQIYGNDDIEIL